MKFKEHSTSKVEHLIELDKAKQELKVHSLLHYIK